MLKTALRYAELGWQVVPIHYPIFTENGVTCSCGGEKCEHQGKHPIPSKWTRDATDDKQQINEWWRIKPQANVGIACGPGSGIFVLDIDGDKSMERMRKFAKENGANADIDLRTVKSKTSRGFHLVFKWDDRLKKLKNWVQLSDDLDIKTDGGQFVAPPSIHKSGVKYEWVTPPWDNEPRNVPEWLINFLEAEEIKKRKKQLEKKTKSAKKKKYNVDKYVDKAIDDEMRILRSASVGERNTQLNESAIKLYGLAKGGYLDKSDVDRELTREARRLGLQEREIRATEDSAWAGAEEREIETYKEITREELDKIKTTNGPGFVNNLPKEHFITRLIEFGKDISDAYSDYWYACGIYALAVASDKKILIQLRQGEVYPNIYVFIAGKSTLSHKSTAVKKIRTMLMDARRKFEDAEAPTEFSPEAFIEHMDRYNHTHWVRDEAAELLASMQKDYMRGFKGSLMQLYDCQPIHRMLRSKKNSESSFRVKDPFMNILWATTDSSLAKNTTQNDTLSGFMARFLYHFPRRPKDHWLPLEEGDQRLSAMEEVVINQLSEIITHMEGIEQTKMHLHKNSAEFFIEWQRSREMYWINSDDEHAMQIYGRLAPTVLKLTMLYELGMPGFDPSRPMRLEFIREACRQVDEYYMPTARALYETVGADEEKNVIDRITRVLKNKGGKTTRRVLQQNVKIKSKDLDEYLMSMEDAGMVEFREERKGDTRGRKSLWVILTLDNVGLSLENNRCEKPTTGSSSIPIVDNVAIVDIVNPGVNKGEVPTVAIATIGKNADADSDNFCNNSNLSLENLLSECERTEVGIDEAGVAKQYGKTVVELRTVLDGRNWKMLRGGQWKPPSRST